MIVCAGNRLLWFYIHVFIYTSGQTLLQQQMDKEDLSCLPTLHINEIDRKIIEEKTATVTSGKETMIDLH